MQFLWFKTIPSPGGPKPDSPLLSLLYLVFFLGQILFLWDAAGSLAVGLGGTRTCDVQIKPLHQADGCSLCWDKAFLEPNFYCHFQVPDISLEQTVAAAVHPTPKACMLKSKLVLMGNVMNSSSFGEKQVFLGLDLQLVHRCSSTDQQRNWPYFSSKSIMEISVVDVSWNQEKQEMYAGVVRRQRKVVVPAGGHQPAGRGSSSNVVVMLWSLFRCCKVSCTVTVLVRELKGQYRLIGGETWRKTAGGLQINPLKFIHWLVTLKDKQSNEDSL